MAVLKVRIRRSRVLCASVLCLLMIGYIGVGRPLLRSAGATTYGSLSSHQSDIVLDDGQRLLAFVTPLNQLSDDSLRFVAMPSFGPRWLAVSLSRTGAGVAGKLAILDRKTGMITSRRIHMQQASFDAMVRHWDDLADGYWGEMGLWLDGTPFGFERKRGWLITSGIGNSPCHYDVLGNLAAAYIAPQAEELADLRAPQIEKLLKSDYC